MAGARTEGTLQLDEDPDFQRRSWLWQRVGWGLIILVALAAGLGLFGSGGLFDKARAGEPGSQLWAEYSRFGRLQAQTSTLRVYLGPGAAAGDRVRLWVSREYLEGVHVFGLTPQPEAVEAGPDRYTFTFRVRDLTEPTAVTFELEPVRPWRLRGRVGLDSGQTLSFSQFVYP